MDRASAFVEILRPANCAMMGLAVLVGASIATEIYHLPEMLTGLMLGFITAFALTAASMIINDYVDREIDKINEPNRPLPSGRVKPNESLLLASVLSILGVSSAFLTNWACLVLASISLVVSMTYAIKGKRTGLLGNFMVSACVAIPFLYGSLVVGEGFTLNAFVFSSLAFLSNTGREITKGIVDVEGDKTNNVKTVALTHGPKIASYISSTFFLVAVFVSVLPIFMRTVSIWFIPFVAITDFGFTASSVRLVSDNSRENAKKTKNLALLWMLSGLVAFIAGTIT